MNNTTNNKVCVVTGTCSGIGQQIAYRLLELSHYVIMIDKFRPEDTISQMTKVNPGGFEFHLADLSDQQSIQSLSVKLLEKHPSIDILVNNAGRHIVERETSTDGFEMNFALNCLGTASLTLHLLDSLQRAPSGKIVNIASEAHRFPGKFNFDDINTENESMLYAYGKSKFGIILFTKALAKKLEGSTVTVNAVCPGLVSTNIFQNFLPRWLATLFGSLSHLGLMATAKDGARTPTKLCCDPEYSDCSGNFYGSHSLLKHFSANKKTDSIEDQERFFTLCQSIVGKNIEDTQAVPIRNAGDVLT